MKFKHIGKLFDQYDVNFPVDEKLVLIHGENGTGKTKTLEMLADFYKNQGENVLYFPLDRHFRLTDDEVESVLVLDSMVNGVFKKLNADYKPWDYSGKFGTHITNGSLQLLNFVGSIMLQNKPTVVIIDTIEKNLDYTRKRIMVEILKNLTNVKKLIVTIYSPESIANHMAETIEIKRCVNLYETSK